MAEPTVIKDKTKVKGGLARAESLSARERKEIAKKAAVARWGSNIPKATHEGILRLGVGTTVEIPCAVLEDGQRLITQSGLMQALGRARQAKGRQYYDADVNMPAFLTAKNLKPFISKELEVTSSQVEFKTLRGIKAFGYSASLLPKVCDVFLDAEAAGKLAHNQKHIAEQAKILIRGLAHVGIIALVDEATGYQYDRARKALEEILEQFVAKELCKWVKTFPDEFYHQICKLKKWKLADINKRGSIFGNLTNNLVYKRLAPGVLAELKRLTPKDSKGRPKTRLFRRLTEDIGHPRLRELLASEITLMRVFDEGEWDAFMKALNKAIPKYREEPLFDPLKKQTTTESGLMPN